MSWIAETKSEIWTYETGNKLTFKAIEKFVTAMDQVGLKAFAVWCLYLVVNDSANIKTWAQFKNKIDVCYRSCIVSYVDKPAVSAALPGPDTVPPVIYTRKHKEVIEAFGRLKKQSVFGEGYSTEEIAGFIKERFHLPYSRETIRSMMDATPKD